MPDTNLETLTIQIETSSGQAADKISELARKLNELKTALGGDGFSKLKDLAAGLRELKEVGKVSISDNFTKNLSALSGAMQAIRPESVSRLSQFAGALKRFEGTSKINISRTLADNLFGLISAVNEMDSEHSTKLKQLGEALSSLSNLKNVTISKSLVNGVQDIAALAEVASPDTIANLERMTSALSRLAGVDMQGVRGVFQAVKGRSVNIGLLGSSPLDIGMEKGTFDTSATSASIEAITQTSKYERLSSALHRVSYAFKSVASAAGRATASVAKFIGQRIGNAISKMAAPIKGLTEKLGGLLSSFKRIALYRLIRTIIKEITKAFGEGINNVYQWSKALDNAGANNFAKNMDDAASSILYLKNSLGAAVAPILNALIPALNSLINKIVEAINWINQLFAALSGAKVWTRAKQKATEFAAAAGGAGKAAKEALRYLLPFDELNILPDDKDKGGGGGGDANGWEDAFEDVDLGDKFAWVDKVKEKLRTLFEPIKKAWENEGQATIDATKQALESVAGLAMSVGKSFEMVWMNGLGQESIELILQIWQELMGIVSAVADGIKKAWDYAETGTRIIRNLWQTFNDILGFIRDILAVTKDWAESIDWQPLLRGLEGVTGSFEKFIEAIKKPLMYIYEYILLPIVKWVIEKLLPKVEELIAAALDFAAALTDKLTPALKTLWEDYLKPVVEFIEQKVIENIDNLKESFEKATKEVETHSGAIGAVMGVFETFKDMCDKVKQAVNDVRDAVKKLSAAFGIEGTPEWHGSLCFATKEAEDEFSGFETAIEIFCKALEVPMKVIEKLAELISHVTNNIANLKATLSGGLDLFTLTPAGYGSTDFKSNGTAAAAYNQSTSSSNNAMAFAAAPRIQAAQTAAEAEKYIEDLLKGRIHASGGFPEDGLFFANHGELVGKFTNGRTAVANNEQIVAGIAQGVEEANEPVVNAIYAVANQIVGAMREHSGSSGVDWDYVAQRVTRAQRSQARAMGTL